MQLGSRTARRPRDERRRYRGEHHRTARRLRGMARAVAGGARHHARPFAKRGLRSAVGARDGAGGVPRRAAVDAEEVVPAAGRAARRLPVGRRRARQELPHGRVFRDRRDPPQDARPFPCVHARSPRGARHAQGRGGSACPRRRADRQSPPPHLLRRVPRLGHRGRDDPRPAARGPVRARRRLRDDVQLSARRAVAERASARAVPAGDRIAEGMAGRAGGRRRHRLPVARAGAGEDLSLSARPGS